MRPRQKGGRVVAHNKRRKPVGRHLCQCWQCIDATSTDPVTGLPVQGQYLLHSRYLIHKLREEKIGVASPQQSSATSPFPPSPQAENLSTPEDQDFDVATGVREEEGSQTVLSRLRGFKTRLDWGLVSSLEESFKHSPPLFIPVKSAGDDNVGIVATYQLEDPRDSPGTTVATYQLDCSALQNSDVLTLRTWLDDIQNYISENNLSRAKNSRIRLCAEAVNRTVQSELDRFNRLMEEQWEKEKVSLKAGHPDAINTSASLHLD